MRTQDALAEATGLSVSVISLAERGIKVDEQTLRQIELGLDWPTNATLDFLATSDDSLLEVDPQPQEDQSHYPPDLQDDFERQLWDLKGGTDEDKWTLIYQWRVRRDAKLRAQEQTPLHEPGSPTQTEQFGG